MSSSAAALHARAHTHQQGAAYHRSIGPGLSPVALRSEAGLTTRHRVLNIIAYSLSTLVAGKAPGSQPSDPDFTQMEQALRVADALVRPNIRAATAAAAATSSTTAGAAAAAAAAAAGTVAATADDMDTSSSSAKAEPVLQQRSDAPRTD
eukprot:15213-Heterococcus_DN1.PRE.3